MKKHIKKLLGVLLVILCVVCLCACGKNETSQKETNDSTNDQTENNTEPETPKFDIAVAIGQSWEEFSKNLTDEELADFKETNREGERYAMTDSKNNWFDIYEENGQSVIYAASVGYEETRMCVNGIAVGDDYKEVKKMLENDGYVLSSNEEVTYRDDIDYTYTYKKDTDYLTVFTKKDKVLSVSLVR